MTAFNVVRFRVKPGHDQEFLGVTDPAAGTVALALK
jgi:hypothetical protein